MLTGTCCKLVVIPDNKRLPDVRGFLSEFEETGGLSVNEGEGVDGMVKEVGEGVRGVTGKAGNGGGGDTGAVEGTEEGVEGIVTRGGPRGIAEVIEDRGGEIGGGGKGMAARGRAGSAIGDALGRGG